MQVTGDLTLPETSALSRLDRGGPSTTSALAKLSADELAQLSAVAPLLERLAQSI